MAQAQGKGSQGARRRPRSGLPGRTALSAARLGWLSRTETAGRETG